MYHPYYPYMYLNPLNYLNMNMNMMMPPAFNPYYYSGNYENDKEIKI